MTSAFQRMLQRVGDKCLIEFERRPKINERVAGYVVGFSDSLILVHRLDWDAFVLNGFSIIRVADVRKYRIFDKESYWQTKAAKRKKFRPSNLGISLIDWRTAISEVERKFPLFGVEKEITSPGRLYLGNVAAIKDKTVMIRGLDPSGEWCGSSRFRFADITRLQFGGGYETALALAIG